MTIEDEYKEHVQKKYAKNLRKALELADLAPKSLLLRFITENKKESWLRQKIRDAIFPDIGAKYKNKDFTCCNKKVKFVVNAMETPCEYRELIAPFREKFPKVHCKLLEHIGHCDSCHYEVISKGLLIICETPAGNRFAQQFELDTLTS